MLWDPFLYCINDSIQGNSETGNKVFVLPSKVAINNKELAYTFANAMTKKSKVQDKQTGGKENE